MSEINVNTIDKATGSTLTVGAAGTTVNIAGTAGTGFPTPTTGIAASAITTGTIATARLGSGTASSSTFLAGDQSYKTVSGTTINNNADNKVITGSGTANTLEAETNLIYNGTLLGCGADGANADQSIGLHVKTSDSGATAASNANQIVVESGTSTNCGMSFLTPTTGANVRINFGTSSDADNGQIGYFPGTNSTDNSMQFKSGGSTTMKLHSTGEVTKTRQPTFLVIPTADLTNMGTGNTTVAWDGEIFDVGSNFSSNTFTAPVTGKYQFNVSFYLANLDIDTTLFDVNMVASNRIQRLMARNISKDFTADSTNLSSINASTLLDMDANDTVYVRIDITGGGGVIDLLGTAPASEFYTSWSGVLIC